MASNYSVNRRGRRIKKRPVTEGGARTTDGQGRQRTQRIRGAQTARRTGSKDKMTVSGQKSITGGPRGAQGPATPPVQGPGRRVTGLIGSRGKSPSKPPVSKPPRAPGRVTPKGSAKGGKGGKGGSIRGTATAVLAGALSSGKLRNPVSKAKQREAAKSIDKYNTRDADGTVRSRAKVGPKKVGPGKVGTVAQAFDKAFAKARKAGKKTFTFKGKTYSTKMK